MLGPSSAIQSSPRIDNAGRRTADGLPGCAAQYDSISSDGIRAGSAAYKAFLGTTLVFLSNLGTGIVHPLQRVAQSGTRWICV